MAVINSPAAPPITAGRATSADRIAVVTVNWNGWANTVECLASLRLSRQQGWHLFIVDNASSDDSIDRLQGLGDDATLIRSPINGGWTGGNNLGVEAALAAGFEWIFILNNDAFVEPDTLELLLAEAQAQAANGAWPILGPIHQGANANDYDFIGSAADPKTGIPMWIEAGHAPAGRLTTTSYISGAGLFANRRHFEQIGLFDDRFYLNFDDTDWCLRAVAMGFPLLMLSDAVIRHLGSASIGGRESPLQTYFMTRNRLLFAEKHCSLSERLRLFRRYVWQARELTGRDNVFGWLGELTGARDGVRAAFRAGVRDYVLRRFGDCPPNVRSWQAAASRARRAGGTEPLVVSA